MDTLLLIALTLLFVAVVAGIFFIAMMISAWAATDPGSGWPELAVVGLQIKDNAASQITNIGSRFRERFKHVLPSLLRENRWQDSPLQDRLAQCGYRSNTAISLLLGTALISTLIGSVAGVITALGFIDRVQPVVVVLSALLGAVLGATIPFIGITLMIRRRQRQLLEHFPDALDLIRVCLEAGLGLDAAIQRVGQEFRQVAPALFDEFHVLSLELRAGAGRTTALQNLAQRTGLAEIRAWVTMIIQSEKFGTGIAEAVKIHSDQLRLTRRLNAEQLAATLSTKLLFPLIFCIFPALLLVLLGPAGITIQQQLGQTIQGQQ